MIKKSLKLFLLVLFFLNICYIFVTAFSSVKKKIIDESRINILLLGISETDYAKFAEVIKLISYEPVTGFLDVVSVPRDTLVNVPYEVTWKRIMKLDEVYARYNRKFKSQDKLFDEFLSKVSEVLKGYFNIDYYIQFDYKAFTDCVDAMGGVEIEILTPMDYDDNAQNLHIHFSTGIKMLNGEESLKYVRYRDKIRGDIGRQERQHAFLSQVMKKLKNFSSIYKIPAIINAISMNTRTNIKMSDIIIFADELRNFELKNFRIQKIPGEPITKWGKSYWKIDEQGMIEVLDVVRNSQLINLPYIIVDKDTKLQEKITTEVWNAAGMPNMARELTEYLRRRNVDVVRYGNYGVRKKYTQIISRNGELGPARTVSKIIGCQNIKTEMDMSRMVDINIVIGKDFRPPWEE